MIWGVIKESEIPVAILSLSLISLPPPYPRIGAGGGEGCLKRFKEEKRLNRSQQMSLHQFAHLSYFIFSLQCCKNVNIESKN